MSGETLDVGVDTGSAVGPYPPEFPFLGRIDRVEIELHDALAEHHDHEFAAGQQRGALSAQ
jgi:hypothetical protein